MDMWHVFICGIYSGAGRVGHKIWTIFYSHVFPKNENCCLNAYTKHPLSMFFDATKGELYFHYYSSSFM